MKTIIAGTLTALMSVSFAAAAIAQTAPADTKAGAKIVIVERDAKGKATKVKIGEDVIPVCMSEAMTDGCINPYEAGLKWGNRPVSTYTDKDAAI